MLGSDAPYTEPIAVPDIFVTSLSEVEDLGGGCFRFTFCCNQRSIHGGQMERVVVARLVATADAVPAALFTAAKGIGMSLCSSVIFGQMENGAAH